MRVLRLKRTVPRLNAACAPLLALLFIAQLSALTNIRHLQQQDTSLARPLLPHLRDDYISRISPITSFKVVNRSASQPTFFQDARDNEEEHYLYDTFVTQYVSFHASRRYSNTSAVLIYRPLRTGFGDRYQRFIKAYYLAVLSRRVLLVDWQTPFPLEQFIENADHDTDFFFRADSDTHRARYNRAVHLDEFNENEEKYFSLLDSSTSNNVLIIDTPAVSKEALTNYSIARMPEANSSAENFLTNVNVHRAVWHHCLRLRPAVVESTRRYLATLGLRFSGDMGSKWNARHLREYVAVHARVGIGFNESHRYRFLYSDADLSVYASCLGTRAVAAASLAGDPPLPIFFATDTPTFRGVFAEHVHEISEGAVPVVYGDWPVMHSTHMAKRIAHKVQNGWYSNKVSATYEHIMDKTYMDLTSIAFSAHVIALYSSFPRFAVAVGNAESLAEIRGDIICTSEAS